MKGVIAMRNFFASIPIPAAGVALGFAALGNLLRDTSNNLYEICGLLSAIFLLSVLGKLLLSFDEFVNDFKNPVMAGVSATVCMSVMQLATYIHPSLPQLAISVWWLGLLSHIALILFYTKEFLFRFKLDEVFPTYFITYVGIVVAALTSPTFQMETIGLAALAFGIAAYALTFIAVTWRYSRHAVPEAVKPLFCIYTAPMSLSLAGYMAVVEFKSVMLMAVMQILAQIIFVVVLTQLPGLLRLSFYPSYAAFTFPFVITATALKGFVQHLQAEQLYTNLIAPLQFIVTFETVLAAGLVAYTALHYANFIAIQNRREEECYAPQEQ